MIRTCFFREDGIDILSTVVTTAHGEKKDVDAQVLREGEGDGNRAT